MASIPTNAEAQLQPLREQLEEALQRPTVEQWQCATTPLGLEQELEEARVAVSELRQQAEQQRLLVRTEEPTAGRTQAWSVPSSNVPQSAEETTPTGRYQLHRPLLARPTCNPLPLLRRSFNLHHSLRSLRRQTRLNDAAVRTASASLQSPIQFSSSTPNASGANERRSIDDADDGNAYDWPTYQLESKPQVEAEPPVRTPTRVRRRLIGPIAWRCCARDVLENTATTNPMKANRLRPLRLGGWSPVSPSSETLDELNQGGDSEVAAGLEEDAL